MRGLFCLLAVLGVLGGAPAASACKCGPVPVGLRELSEDYTVFVGTAVEHLQRDGDGGEPGRAGHRVNAATRFYVHYSLDVPAGSSLTIALDIYTSCSTHFAVGERHLVVAFKVGELLFADRCPRLGDRVEHAVLAQLGVPAGFLRSRAPESAPAPLRCQHPATLDEAFQAADAVGWWRAKASCVVRGSDVVEHAAVMSWGWKGLGEGDVFRLRVVGSPEEPPTPPFSSELVNATEMWWPPADFLRRQGDTFVHDGCLSPLAPASLEEGKEAVLRLFPLPADYRSRRSPFPKPRPRLPALRCMTLDDSYFTSADAALARYARTYSVEHARKTERKAVAPPPRDGSCAGCVVAPHGARTNWLWPALLLLALGLRIRPKGGRAVALPWTSPRPHGA